MVNLMRSFTNGNLFIKEPDSPFVLGIYYDTGRLFLFKRIGDEITRFDNNKSFPTSQRVLRKQQNISILESRK